MIYDIDIASSSMHEISMSSYATFNGLITFLIALRSINEDKKRLSETRLIPIIFPAINISHVQNSKFIENLLKFQSLRNNIRMIYLVLRVKELRRRKLLTIDNQHCSNIHIKENYLQNKYPKF